MKNNPFKKQLSLYTQPHVFCDKILYKKYSEIVKQSGKNIIEFNKLVFEKAVKEQIEAFEKMPEEPKKLFTDLI